MDVEKIVLNKSEKKMLRRIKKYGYARTKTAKEVDEMCTLRECGLIGVCDDDRFPAVYDDYGNEEQNAYCIDKIRERQYSAFLQSKSAKAFKEWIAIIISAFAVLISLLSFIYSIKANDAVQRLQEERAQQQEETLR